MSLDKAIKHGKEHRKPYFGAKSVDRTCRNHGSCPYCRSNRFHKHMKVMQEDNEIGGCNGWILQGEQ